MNWSNCGMKQGLRQKADALQDKPVPDWAKEDADYIYTRRQWGTDGNNQETGSTIRQVTHEERLFAKNKELLFKVKTGNRETKDNTSLQCNTVVQDSKLAATSSLFYSCAFFIFSMPLCSCAEIGSFPSISITLMDTETAHLVNSNWIQTKETQQSRRVLFYFHPCSIFHPCPLTSTFRGSSPACDHIGDGHQLVNSSHATAFYSFLHAVGNIGWTMKVPG